MSDLFKPDHSIVFAVGQTTVKITPSFVGEEAVLSAILDTPIGPIDMRVGMPRDTYFELLKLVRERNMIPRLTDLIEGNFKVKVAGLSVGLGRRNFPRR